MTIADDEMPVGEHRYTIHDLVVAQTNAVRYAEKAPALASFHSTRYRAFALAFGLPEKSAPLTADNAALTTLMDTCIERLVHLDSPFSRFLEAPEVICDFACQFDDEIQARLRALERAIEELLEAILPELHGIPATRTVDDGDLRRHGFDPSTAWVDEYDFV